ncbi:thiolase family protein [Mariniblastus sp.]|nr:thiolase family protein [Mariniblastus sp.]
MPKAIFTSGLRTPFGRSFKGAYRDVRADDLLVEVLKAQAGRHPELWSACPEDLIVGCAYPEHEQGYNVGRLAALGAGLDVPGMVVNRLCASSLEAVAVAAARIKASWGTKFLTAGIESMSRIPRRGANFSESECIKSINPHAYIPNGQTAEQVAVKYPQFDRVSQEDFAERSHTLAHQAHQSGAYSEQLHPYLIACDEFVRYPVNRKKIASLPPAFSEDGTVTAATSSPLTDGATSGWVLEEACAKSLGISAGLEVVDVQYGHVPPELMGLGPVPATQKIFERNRITAKEVSAFEINEAFAIQVLASAADLEIPMERVNSWGGALALGHPLGASGLRLVMTLHDRLKQRGEVGALGVATLCVGGGQGMSILFRWVRV